MVMNTANTDTASAWDGPEGESWAANAASYERATRRIWTRFLGSVPGFDAERVLDIGCGNGKSTCDLAGTAASAVGIDLSTQMLSTARDRATSLGLTNVSFVQGDAQVYEFEPGAFSLATSLFGVMFFANPTAAFKNICAALVPEGRLAVLAWRRLGDNEWVTTIRESLAAGRELPTPQPGTPGPFAFASASPVAAALEAAGFDDVWFGEWNEWADMGADADEAFGFRSTVGMARSLLEDLDEAAQAEALDRLRAAIAAHETQEGVLFKAAAWLITARRKPPKPASKRAAKGAVKAAQARGVVG
jgi:SAM-dependent methyltransferase